MRGESIGVRILSVRYLSAVSDELCAALGLQGAARCVGLISSDSDDATFIALDEATKRANAEVCLARSLYAGAAHASSAISGEVVGVLAADTPAEVQSGMAGALQMLRGGVSFRKANEKGDILYLSHCVSSCGSFLSRMAKIDAGGALAYLIAPPVAALCALDAALKAADVRLARFFEPPTETNFCGGLLTGTQSACRAACDAFEATVWEIAQNPLENGGIYGP